MNRPPCNGARRAGPRVLLCHGCCCGSPWKNPEINHAEQIVEISSVARTRVVDCVGECSQSIVVIVRPGDGSSIWFGGIDTPALTSVLREWLAVGAPQPMPPVLQSKVFVRESDRVGAGA